MRRAIVIAMGISSLLTGCMSGGTMLADPAKMSKEQLEAFAKLKEANVWCVVANTPYGKGSSVAINTDRNVTGTLKVGDSCAIEFTGPSPK